MKDAEYSSPYQTVDGSKPRYLCQNRHKLSRAGFVRVNETKYRKSLVE